MEFLRYQQPLARTLTDMLGSHQFGMWGVQQPWNQPRCEMRRRQPHVPVLIGLFQQPSTTERTCRRRCQGNNTTQEKCQRPEVWEETVDVSHLNPETIQVRCNEGKVVINGIGQPLVDRSACKSLAEWTKHVQLPDGLIAPSLRSYITGEKLYLFGLKKPENPTTETAKKTAETTESVAQALETDTSTEQVSCDAADADVKDGENPTTQQDEGHSERPDTELIGESSLDDTNQGDIIPEETSPVQKSEDAEMDFEFVPKTCECYCEADTKSLTANVGDEQLEENEEPEVDTGSCSDEEDENEKEDCDMCVMDVDNSATALRNDIMSEASTKTAPNTGNLTKVVPNSEASEPSQHFLKKFNLRGFEPTEMKVKLTGRDVMVTAEHKEETEDSISFRQYRQSITLPADVILSDVTSRLNEEGILEISGPLTVSDSGEKELAIQLQ